MKHVMISLHCQDTYQRKKYINVVKIYKFLTVLWSSLLNGKVNLKGNSTDFQTYLHLAELGI